MNTRLLAASAVALLTVAAPAADTAPDSRSNAELLDRARRVVFLGDSITASGLYVASFDAWLLTRPGAPPAVIDAGLASETVSGLSEEGHAGGAFPRPDLAERLDRVLAVTKPDLVVACYGINCGIYAPFDEGRFARYQEGMRRLKAKVEAAGAEFVVMTPPVYDDARKPLPFAYDAVLARYADWLLSRRAEGWRVADLHGPMAAELRRRREAAPGFTFQPDGVHPDAAGHWLMARTLIGFFGDEAAAAADSPEAMLAAKGMPANVLPVVRERVNVLRDAYVAAAGHTRPGVAKGLSLPEAEAKAEDLTARIHEATGRPR